MQLSPELLKNLASAKEAKFDGAVMKFINWEKALTAVETRHPQALVVANDIKSNLPTWFDDFVASQTLVTKMQQDAKTALGKSETFTNNYAKKLLQKDKVIWTGLYKKMVEKVNADYECLVLIKAPPRIPEHMRGYEGLNSVPSNKVQATGPQSKPPVKQPASQYDNVSKVMDQIKAKQPESPYDNVDKLRGQSKSIKPESPYDNVEKLKNEIKSKQPESPYDNVDALKTRPKSASKPEVSNAKVDTRPKSASKPEVRNDKVPSKK